MKQLACSRQVVDAAFGLHPLKAAALFVGSKGTYYTCKASPDAEKNGERNVKGR